MRSRMDSVHFYQLELWDEYARTYNVERKDVIKDFEKYKVWKYINDTFEITESDKLEVTVKKIHQLILNERKKLNAKK
ncbi:MAG: DUF3791 domain-containing protein [Clostridia bacterium]|nr:DUF3791 domain-containing protein [Clostridia bacterium]